MTIQKKHDLDVRDICNEASSEGDNGRPAISRRDFLKFTGTAAIGAGVAGYALPRQAKAVGASGRSSGSGAAGKEEGDRPGTKIRTIAIEEHFTIPQLKEASQKAFASGKSRSMIGIYAEEHRKILPTLYQKLLDLGEGRLADMDRAGIDMQVLQLSGFFEGISKADATSIICESNDILAEAIKAHPDRFAGLAQLPMRDPEKAAAELDSSLTVT
jgi:Amidohydrolase